MQCFYKACAIHAASPADFVAKWQMTAPELREAVTEFGRLATLAFNSLDADLSDPSVAPSPAPAEAVDEIDFTPWDINGACPIPTRDVWIEAADTALPWLRIAFAFMCRTKADLGRDLCEMSDEAFEPIIDSIKHQQVRFQQIADMAGSAVARIVVAMEAHAASAGVKIEDPARG